MEQPCKTPLEDLRKQALAHYEEACNAITHWSSFVSDAIKAYNPEKPKAVNSDYNTLLAVKKIANNALYFDDGSDYISALWEILQTIDGKKYEACPKLIFIE